MPSKLDRAETRQLVECAQYLNLEEMRDYCARNGLALMIHVERPDGTLRRTSDRDRKDVVVARIVQFALHGECDGPTVYRADVVSSAPLPARITSRTRVRYNQYEKKNPRFVETLEKLTGGEFQTGMIARLVLRDFWTEGRAPTMAEFAEAWLRATEAHTRPRPEGAYLVDRWRGEAGANWKDVRRKNARKALRLLERARRASGT